MFNFIRSETPTGKHRIETHPSPVTVAELVARERAE